MTRSNMFQLVKINKNLSFSSCFISEAAFYILLVEINHYVLFKFSTISVYVFLPI